MKRNCLLVFTACLCFASLGFAGDLWLHSTTGSEIFLDGESLGVIESVDAGIRVPGLALGEHTVTVWKDGVMSAEFGFALGYAPTQVVVVGPGSLSENASAEAADSDETPQSVGAIEVTSNPKECDIRLGTRKYTKEQPILTFVGLPIGEHHLRFESEGATLSSAVAVQTGRPAQVKVNFSDNRVVVIAAPGVGVTPSTEETPRAEIECIEYWVEVLRSDNPELLKSSRDALREQGFPSYHQKLVVDNENPAYPVYKLRVGPITRDNMAKHVAALLRHGGFKTSWVVPAECDPSLAGKRVD